MSDRATTPRRTHRRTLAGFAVAALLTVPTAGAEVVAKIDGRPIVLAELEARVAGALKQLEGQRQRLLEGALTELVEERLLGAEAERRGVTLEELVAAEIDARVTPVSNDEVDAWYRENQASVRRPLAAVSDEIAAYLRQQRTAAARGELVERLRRTHRVRLLLEPYRLAVDAPGAASRGPADAPVTLVEFSDFQCPACRRIAPVVDRLGEAYGDRLRIAFRHFPLEQIHPDARRAAEASLCAADQGRFWEMHDALFAEQTALDLESLKGRGAALGLDFPAFEACLERGTHAAAVTADQTAGREAGVAGTPALFVNGRPVVLLRGTPPFDQLASVIDDELARIGSAPSGSVSE